MRIKTYAASINMSTFPHATLLTSAGKFADIIAVKGDVLEHIDLLSRVDLVMKHGKRVK